MAGLTVERISHRFGDRLAIRDLSLQIADGEIVCLLGPSGCGKSTTLRLVAGLEPLQAGRILIGGAEVAGPHGALPPERRGVGLVFQDYALFPHLSVADNVAFGLAGPAGERKARVAEILAHVGLSHLGAAYPHTLSGGEQQRVALARALAPRPRLMLMDEPFSGLDVRLRDQVRDDTLKLLRAEGTSTLLVTHDPEEAMRMADRIALMQGGALVQFGPPVELYNLPANSFVAKFFSEINELPVIIHLGTARGLFGELSAPDLPDGAGILVVRPEAIRLSAAGIPARVAEARMLGPYGLAWLDLADGTRLTARIAASELPIRGSEVRLAIDPAGAYVFASDGA